MTDNGIRVTVWQHLGSNVWALTGDIANYTSLRFSPTFLEDGDWEMEVPYGDAGDASRALLEKGALVSIEFRDEPTAWRVTPRLARNESGELILTVSGGGALGLLGDELAWLDPTIGLGQQDTLDKGKLYSGDGETVLRQLVNENYITRAGRPLELRANQNRGADIRSRPKMTNLKELLVRKARVAGLGVDVVLLKSGTTRGKLQLRIWEPLDRSADVHLSEIVGTLTEWSTTTEPPTMTEAIVAGVTDPVTGIASAYVRVTTPDSLADAAVWGVRSGLVSGPESYDPEDLVQAGEEALAEGKSKTNVALTAADTDGLMAFRDYTVGDKATATLVAGVDIVDVISSIQVTVEDGYPEVVPMFGDPSSDDPVIGLAQLIRSVNRRLSAQEQKG